MDFSYHRSLGESTSAESTFRGFLIPGGWLTEIVTLSNIAYDTMPAEFAFETGRRYRILIREAGTVHTLAVR